MVIDASWFEVLVVPCTTKRTADALRLLDPLGAGLRRKTWLRPHPVKLGRSAFIERLGRVTVEDFERALSVVHTTTCGAAQSRTLDARRLGEPGIGGTQRRTEGSASVT